MKLTPAAKQIRAKLLTMDPKQRQALLLRVRRLLAQRTAVKAFDPKEARDPRGRWRGDGTLRFVVKPARRVDPFTVEQSSRIEAYVPGHEGNEWPDGVIEVRTHRVVKSPTEKGYDVEPLGDADGNVINLVQVAPEHRGKGVASALYDEAVRQGYQPNVDKHEAGDFVTPAGEAFNESIRARTPAAPASDFRQVDLGHEPFWNDVESRYRSPSTNTEVRFHKGHGLTPEEQQKALDTVHELSAKADLHVPVTIRVKPQSAFKGSTGGHGGIATDGFTGERLGTIGINSAMFKPTGLLTEKHGDQTGRYAVAHELGHVHDEQGEKPLAQGRGAKDFAAANNVSGYGTKDPHENYAEAYGAWLRGDDSPAVQAYAAKFGWQR